MQRSDVALSKTMARALRHAPGVYGLELDDQGWVPLAQLVAALQRKGGRWAGVTCDDIARVATGGSKQRFEIAGERIRARYGHSLPGRLTRPPAPPPRWLYHGTSPDAAALIAREGLRPMTRQDVHLSTDVDTALAVGRRKAAAPVVLRVDAASAAAAGVEFARGGDRVWLAAAVPARFVAPLQC